MVKKSEFFILRSIGYLAFLLIPIFAKSITELSNYLQVLLMTFYLIFMIGQWFLLGKELENRFKIYLAVNSSMDRVIYRVLLGSIVLTLYYKLISFFPEEIMHWLFWGTWALLGLFYSWPTRGKIIAESLSTEIAEGRFLDSFEKIVLGTVLLFFFISIPKMPGLDNREAMLLYIDPQSTITPLYWNFLETNFLPFTEYPGLFRLGHWLYIYFIGMGLFLLAFYALLRIFFTRRLAIFGFLPLFPPGPIVRPWPYP